LIYRMMLEEMTYTVPGIHCHHCVASITEEINEVAGVESVDVDLTSKILVVHGRSLSDPALREAIREAGYEAA
jgi:copper chaperone